MNIVMIWDHLEVKLRTFYLSYRVRKERWNIAKMGLYREYFEAIRKAEIQRRRFKELFGDKYVSMLNGLSGKNTESDLTLMSRL